MYCICCGMEVDNKEYKCPRCGCILDNLKVKETENKNSGFIFCPTCGNIFSNSISVCIYCGCKI